MEKDCAMKIRYNLVFDSITSINLPNKNSTNRGRYINIYCILNEFMKTNPPCKECLVQPTCVLDMICNNLSYPFLYIKLCNDLKKFVTNNEIFENNNLVTLFKKNK